MQGRLHTEPKDRRSYLARRTRSYVYNWLKHYSNPPSCSTIVLSLFFVRCLFHLISFSLFD